MRARALFLLLCAAAHPSAADLGDGLVLHWRFDEDSGSLARDASAHGNSGEIRSGTWIPGPVDGALAFDGRNGWVECPQVIGLRGGDSPHSCAAWIRIDGPHANRSWLLLLGGENAGTEYWLLLGGGMTQIGVWDGGQVWPQMPPQTWHFMTTTFDGARLRCYRDSGEVADTLATFRFPGRSFSVGKPHLGESPFAGAIDDVRVYDRCLTPEEIGVLFRLGRKHAPVAVGTLGPQVVNHGRPFAHIIPDETFSDPDGDPLSWQALGQPDGLTFQPRTRLMSGTPVGNGLYEMTLMVTDPAGMSGSQSLTISVIEPAGEAGLSPTHDNF